jgi:enamine deaminase RidA (YjgF/YER057c/UK114 family)
MSEIFLKSITPPQADGVLKNIINKIYEGYFREDEPGRSTIIAALALPNILIEIDCIAYSGSPL